MRTEKPLEVTVRPRGPAFVLKFAQDLIPLFEGTNRIDAVATAEGLTLHCLWERDLEWAEEKIRGTFSDDLLWGKPQVKLLPGEVAGRAVFLEPMLKIHVHTPEEFSGIVMGDLSGRRGMITGMDDVSAQKLIHAQVPLSELIGYSSWLAKTTNGEASAVAEFDSYQEAPKGQGPDPSEPMSAALRA